jgi:hypothetical protein
LHKPSFLCWKYNKVAFEKLDDTIREYMRGDIEFLIHRQLNRRNDVMGCFTSPIFLHLSTPKVERIWVETMDHDYTLMLNVNQPKHITFIYEIVEQELRFPKIGRMQLMFDKVPDADVMPNLNQFFTAPFAKRPECVPNYRP